MKKKDQHIAFWRELSEAIDAGVPRFEALTRAGKRAGGGKLGQTPDSLKQQIGAGAALSEAMEKHADVFTPAVRLMVRAGEAGGVLDVIVKRIIEGLQDGSFPLPGDRRSLKAESVACWRAFGRLLSSGVPVLQVLDVLAEEARHKQTRRTFGEYRQAIVAGQRLSEAMKECSPDLPEQAIMGVRLAEEQGELHECAFRLADAIERDELDTFVEPEAEEVDLDSLPDAEGIDVVGPGQDAGQAPVVKLVNLVLLQALKDGATDVHFEPHEDKFRIRYRVDGVLYEMMPPPRHLARPVVNRLKVMAALDVAEYRLPQVGRIELNVSGQTIDIRMSTMPTAHGERAALRIVRKERTSLSLEALGLAQDHLAEVRRLAHLPNGIVIVTGPAGAGKTTLLYSMLSELNEEGRCLFTIEDPVECTMDGIAQIQIDPRNDFTYAGALRSVLRQDPDVIMVGEIRDLETLQLCVQTALTGHLVLTTLHTNNAPAALARLLDLGLEPFLVNSTVAGVVGIRLVRTLCQQCKAEIEPDPNSVPPEVVEFMEQSGRKTFYAPAGCDACHQVGNHGRTGIFEVLVPDQAVRDAVSAPTDHKAIQRAALASGMKPMLLDGIEKAAAGIVSLEEVLRVAPRTAVHGSNGSERQ